MTDTSDQPMTESARLWVIGIGVTLVLAVIVIALSVSSASAEKQRECEIRVLGQSSLSEGTAAYERWMDDCLAG